MWRSELRPRRSLSFLLVPRTQCNVGDRVMRSLGDRESEIYPITPPLLAMAENEATTPQPTSPWDEELQRTAFQKKAVSRLSAAAVLDLAIACFTERGYRAGR